MEREIIWLQRKRWSFKVKPFMNFITFGRRFWVEGNLMKTQFIPHEKLDGVYEWRQIIGALIWEALTWNASKSSKECRQVSQLNHRQWQIKVDKIRMKSKSKKKKTFEIQIENRTRRAEGNFEFILMQIKCTPTQAARRRWQIIFPVKFLQNPFAVKGGGFKTKRRRLVMLMCSWFF